MKNNNDNFIMLPTVDYCFKELMKNPKVRQGFIAALLNKRPEEIAKTTLLPTIIEGETVDGKASILDVRVLLADGTQMDMEMQVEYFEYWDRRVLFYLGKMFVGQLEKGDSYEKLKKCIHVSILNFHCFPDEKCYRKIHLCDSETGQVYTDILELQILELPKLPRDVKSGENVITWMKFFSGKSREEFVDMAKTNEYLDEAYDTLVHLSADEKKRIAYEAREKALRDYNSQMGSAERRGERRGREEGRKEGREEGREEGRKQAKQIFLLDREGKSHEEIAEICGVSVDVVREMLE